MSDLWMKAHPLQGVIVNNFFPREVFVTVESVKKKQDLPTSEDLSLIIKGRFAQVPPQELRHISLRFSQELYSIISSFLPVINLAVFLEYFSFLLPLTFSKSKSKVSFKTNFMLWRKATGCKSIWRSLCGQLCAKLPVWHCVRALHDPFYSMKPGVALGLAKPAALYKFVALILIAGGHQLRGLMGMQCRSPVLDVIL